MTNHFDPIVSVVIPTYNRAALITRSIPSVLNQTFQNIEVIVVDDGSTDETADVVGGLHDARIKYIRLPSNTGAGASRNIGIHRSAGDFLAFQDSDDEWLPENLARHMSAFKGASPKLGVVYSDMLRISEDGTVKYHPSPVVVPGRLINPDTQFYQVFGLGIQSVVLKRECLEAVGYFDEKLTAFEDLELLNRLSERYDFFHIQEPLVRYYETKGLSKNNYANRLARKRLLKLYYKKLWIRNTAFLIKECRWLYRTRSKPLQRKLRRLRRILKRL